MDPKYFIGPENVVIQTHKKAFVGSYLVPSASGIPGRLGAIHFLLLFSFLLTQEEDSVQVQVDVVSLVSHHCGEVSEERGKELRTYAINIMCFSFVVICCSIYPQSWKYGSLGRPYSYFSLSILCSLSSFFL